ncbi:MAG: (d)CMP kinase [Tannerellaceae bacterium]|nr:(d)CMP kinase [Tannerellaceae bacterium]
MKKIVIALDGYSSCGKSTMAKDLARQIGYTYIDTGAMYRAVTLYSMRNGIIKNGTIDTEKLERSMKDIHISFVFNPETGRPDTYLNGENIEKEIRTMEVAGWVSPVAALSFVRKALVSQQKQMGETKGVVLDGRDVGTVIFPDAELKIFVTAKPEVRAQRRLDESLAKGESVTFEEVLRNVQERDLLDTTRKEGPLKKADDAIVLDNSDMSIEEQKEWLLEQFNQVVTK